jgi:hypothetical protein
LCADLQFTFDQCLCRQSVSGDELLALFAYWALVFSCDSNIAVWRLSERIKERERGKFNSRETSACLKVMRPRILTYGQENSEEIDLPGGLF